MRDAHQLRLVNSPFLTLQHVTMKVRNHDLGVNEVAMDLRNDVATNVGCGAMRISRCWRQRLSRRTGYNIRRWAQSQLRSLTWRESKQR